MSTNKMEECRTEEEGRRERQKEKINTLLDSAACEVHPTLELEAPDVSDV